MEATVLELFFQTIVDHAMPVDQRNTFELVADDRYLKMGLSGGCSLWTGLHGSMMSVLVRVIDNRQVVVLRKLCCKLLHDASLDGPARLGAESLHSEVLVVLRCF